MRLWRMVPVVVLVALVVAGCETAQIQERPKQTAGALTGAALGGRFGSLFGGGRGNRAATGAGVLLGGLLGSEVGKSLDRADRAAAAQATYSALEYNPSGTPSSSRNPDSGAYGTVMPTRTYGMRGLDCRDFRQEVILDGRAEVVHGTACRQPDGTWRMANN